MNGDDIKRSKMLSKALRHDPAGLGLHPDGAGWVDVDAVLRACAARGISWDRADLERVVATNDKQRFAFNRDGRGSVRARATPSTWISASCRVWLVDQVRSDFLRAHTGRTGARTARVP